MPRHTLEVASIFRQYGKDFRSSHSLSATQRQLMRAIETCRTSALGGHIEQCGHCQYARIAYNSCRNRHCPKCQTAERRQWFDDRKQDLLPIQYFHLVFTLPQQIAELALQNPRLLYGLLFRISAETLSVLARDPKHLGAEIGFFSVLHTWGQNLLFHPHIHCVVTGGGLAEDGERFICTRPGFFLPVRVLSSLFRRLFLDALDHAHSTGQLRFWDYLEPLRDPKRFAALLQPLRRAPWVVYAKPPFGGPAQALAYLARYTHRVAISNERLLSSQNGEVTFQWKDYRHQHQSKSMTIGAPEFIRRFLLHALPRGFQRIRHYGLLANCHRIGKLQRCRLILTAGVASLLPAHAARSASRPSPDRTLPQCPLCRLGKMARVLSFTPFTLNSS